MTEFRNRPVWVIRNSNLDIVWDLVPAGRQDIGASGTIASIYRVCALKMGSLPDSILYRNEKP